MKKPLIILVDDDPAVLLALEAALRSTFESIARIETFESGQAVLDAVPVWKDEKRPIAVAIVDQKMLGMTGVELLTRLRGAAVADPAHCAAHMRSILLTGYAGLDSVVAARNEAGVERYLEKPWISENLSETVMTAFVRAIESGGAATRYVFRQVTAEDEIRAHLELRHRVYRASIIGHVLPAGEVPLDVDEYDLASRHYGVFRASSGGDLLVGTLRVTGTEVSPWAGVLRQVLAAYPELLDRMGAERPHPLPMMKYLLDRDAVAQLVDDAAARGERLVEPGRLTVAPEFRAGAMSGRHVARHITESSVAFFFLDVADHAVLTCVPPHDRFYTRVGFALTPGTQPKYHEFLGHVVICLHARVADVPESARETIGSLASRIRRTGATCLCETFPNCLPGPYETGDFAGVDAFCPIALTEAQQDARRKTQDARRKTQDARRKTDPRVFPVAA